jgi:hypothetical protein
MNVSLYQAAAAMNANARWQEVISSNLAASSVPGFKKDEITFSAIEAGVMPAEGPTRQSYSMWGVWWPPATASSRVICETRLETRSRPPSKS